MTPLQIGLTLSTSGEILLAVVIILVHHKVKTEQKIDPAVISEITHEEILGVLAILLIFVGYIIQVRA